MEEPTTTPTTTTVSVREFEQLVSTISQQRLPVRIRFRTRGDLWYPNFLRVIKGNEHNRILFYDEGRTNNIILSDFSTVIQFELDAAVHSFESRCHYQVSEDYFME